MFKRIVHIITRLEPGGAQRNTLYTLENLEKGWAGRLLCGPGGRLDKEARDSGAYSFSVCPFLIRKVCPPLDILAFFWLFFYLLSFRPHIVHTHSSKAGIIGRWAARCAGVPVIIHTFHGFGFTPLQKKIVRNFFIFLEKITAPVTGVLIGVARDNLRRALKEKIGRKEQYRVIHSGVEIEKFEKNGKFANIRKDLGIKPAEKVVGNISCFKPQKGLEIFVKTCALLDKKGEYRYLMAGDGILRPKIEKMIKDKGLEEKFILTGWVKGAEKVLPAMDVMLHTAYFEGLPRVIPEAMAAGVPVVATAADGTVDIIEDGVNGFLAPPGNVLELARKTEKLLEKKKLRERFAASALKRLDRGFNIKNMSAELNEMYSRLYRKINGAENE